LLIRNRLKRGQSARTDRRELFSSMLYAAFLNFCAVISILKMHMFIPVVQSLLTCL